MENILTKTFGDTPNLRILGFFLATDPDYKYNVSQISEITKVSRDTTRKYLNLFSNEKLIKIHDDSPIHYFSVNFNNEIMKRMEQNLFDFIDYKYDNNIKLTNPIGLTPSTIKTGWGDYCQIDKGTAAAGVL